MKQSPACPAAQLLMFLSQPHTLTIIYTLGSTTWGFNELQQATGVNTRTLTKRLQALLHERIVEVAECSTDARCRHYRLSKRGRHINRTLAKLS